MNENELFWRVRVRDDMENPKCHCHLLVQGGADVVEVATAVKNSEAWGMLIEKHPTLEIASIEVLGVVDVVIAEPATVATPS